MPKIHQFLAIKQREKVLLAFVLPAKKLITMGEVHRFEDADAEGVNRQMCAEHVKAIAKVMANDQKMCWPEPLICAPKGEWEYDGQTLSYEIGAKLSCDDGQHRLLALQSDLMPAEQLAELEFMVVLLWNFGYLDRVRVFGAQGHRRPIDSRLVLRQRDRLGEWEKPIDEEAYKLIKALNELPDSPLQGRLQLTETGHRPHEIGGGAPINSKGLMGTVRSLIGQKSPLYSLPFEKKLEVCLRTIRAAQTVWPRLWESDKHVLATARGINALLFLFIRGVNFNRVLGGSFELPAIVQALAYGQQCKWTIGSAENLSHYQLTDRLDGAIGRGHQAILVGPIGPAPTKP